MRTLALAQAAGAIVALGCSACSAPPPPDAAQDVVERSVDLDAAALDTAPDGYYPMDGELSDVPVPVDVPTDVTPTCPAWPGTDAGTCPAVGCSVAENMQLMVGYGDSGATTGFREFAPGDNVDLVIGPQGGLHIYVAVRGRGFNSNGPQLTLQFVRASDCLPMPNFPSRPMFTADPGDATLLVTPTFNVTIDYFAPSLAYCAVLGKDAILVATLDDMFGHRAHTEVRVHVSGIVAPGMPQSVVDQTIAACTPIDGGGGG